MSDAQRSRRVAVAAFLLLVAAIAPLVLGAESASATGCARDVLASVEYRDGGWWTYRFSPGCGGSVVRYDDEWNPTGDRVESAEIVETAGNEAFDAVVDIQATRTGWFVFGEKGYVYRTNRSFVGAERVRDLPRPVYGGVRGPAGNWWIETDDGVRVVDDDGNRTLHRIDGQWSVSVRGADVYLVGNRPFGGIVRRYDVPENWSGETPPPLAERVTVGPEVRNPAVVTDGPSGRVWIVTTYGHRLAYHDWRLVVSSYDDPLWGVLLHGTLFLLPAILVALVGVGLSAFFGEEPGRWVLAALATVPLAVVLRQALVPFPLTALYWLPDPMTAAVLASPTVAALAALRVRDRLDALPALRYVLMTAPLLLLAFDFLRAP